MKAQHANNTLYLNSLMTNTKLYEEFVEIMKQFDPDFVLINLVGDGEKAIQLMDEYGLELR